MSRITMAPVSDGVARVLGAGGCVGVAPSPEDTGAFKKLRVLVQPYGDSTSASARIRVWNRLGAIKDRIEIALDYDGIESADVVYIQKRVNTNTLALVETAHLLGKKVVFDIDDALGCSASEELNIEMLRRADAITVDTRFKRDEFSRYTDKPIEVIPDGIDYFTEWFDFDVRDSIETVCTFGWEHNTIAAAPFVNSIADKYRTAYITNRQLAEFPASTFIKWELPTFIDTLKTFDAVILAHGDHPNDRLRCCNRFLTAAFCGLVTVTKDTPEYRETLEDLGASFMLAGDPSKVYPILYGLAKERSKVIPMLRKAIWKKYQPRVGGEKLLKILRSV